MSPNWGALQQVNLNWGPLQQRVLDQTSLMSKKGTFVMTSFREYNARTQSTHGKPKGQKTMLKLETNYNYFNYLGPVFPSKESIATVKERPNLLVEV